MQQTDLEQFVPPGSMARPAKLAAFGRRRESKEGSDFYPTPAWCTKALLVVEEFTGTIHEPACGTGDMSRVLMDAGHAVYSSDLHDRGFGAGEVDFLDSARRSDNIITNPPFKKADAFVRQACKLARSKVAMFLPITFLSGGDRQVSLFRTLPPTRVWVFSERPTLFKASALKSDEKKNGGVTTYCWFVWDKTAPAPAHPEIRWIPLGLKPKAPRKPSTRKKRENLQ